MPGAAEPGAAHDAPEAMERLSHLTGHAPGAAGAVAPVGGPTSAQRVAADPPLDGRIGALPEGLTRDQLIAGVARAVTDVPQRAAMLVAVSGGPDSTTMAHLLSLARPDLELELVHVRHGLRDDAADAAAAAAHAAALGVAYHEERVEVRVSGRGPEAAARDARYDALLRRAAKLGIAWLAVGHTADDQAETVLLNLVRGSGLRGVAGMRAIRTHGQGEGERQRAGGWGSQGEGERQRAGGRGSQGEGERQRAGGRGSQVHIVRPLLRIRRSDVGAFIEGEGLLAVADPTNRDPRQRRARARHEVLPVLARLAGGPGDVVASLNRLAELARIDTEALDALASEHASRLVMAWGGTYAIRRDLLALLPLALSSRILRLVAAAVDGDLSADAVARVLALGSGEALHIAGGAAVSCGGGWLGFAPRGLQPLAREPLIIPGTTPLPQLGLDVHVEWPWPVPPSPDPGQLDLGGPEPPTVAQVADDRPPGALAGRPPGAGPRARMWAVFGADVGRALVAGDDFAVRARRDGDRLRSSVGVRKLQDLFVDARVPRVCRDLVPVLVDEHDEPLWVPGIAQRVCDSGEPAAIRVWLAPGDTES